MSQCKLPKHHSRLCRSKPCKSNSCSTKHRITDSANYATYVAGKLNQSAQVNLHTLSDPTQKPALEPVLFSSYHYPRAINGNLLPATKDHVLTFVNSGNIQGRYRYNSDTWQKAGLMRHEWSITKAYENAMQWQWQAKCKSSEPVVCTKIHIPDKLLHRTAQEVFELNDDNLELSHRLNVYDIEMQNALLSVTSEAYCYEVSPLYLETMAHLLSVHIVRYYCGYRQLQHHYRDLPLQKLRKVIEYIRCHFNHNISLHDLAAIAAMSPFHFAHSFKRYIGLAPHQYVTHYRIECAKALLKTQHFTIDRIAAEVGYDSRNHFSLLFKRIVGLTPRQFRIQQGK